MGQTISIFFGGSWIGIAIAVGLLIFFYKWTGSKVVVAVVAVFLIVTRFTWITLEPATGDDGKIQEIGASEKK
jgi:hypothetical protein